jgi:tetratricopeptide (TPR) repeat protein
LRDDPQVRSKLLEHIGRAYRRRNDDKTAVSYLQDAVELRSKMSQGADDEERAALMVELAISIRESGDVLGSDNVLREAGDMLQRLKAERSLTYARMLANRGRVQMRLGKVDAAQAYFDQSLALFQDRLGPRHHEVATLLVEKATAFLWEDDNVAAERNAREAVDIYSAVFPPLHPDRAQAQAQLGEALRLQGHLDEASVMFKEALNAYSIVFGDDDRRVADVLDSLAKIRRAQRDLSDAEKFAQQAVDVAIKADGSDHERTAYYRTSLAAIQIERREYAAAEEQLNAALVTFNAKLVADHPYIASAKHYLGEVLLQTNRVKDAEVVFMEAMNQSKHAKEPEWRQARSASGLGEALYRQGRTKDAETYLVSSYRTLSADRNADPNAQSIARQRVERFFTDRGQPERLQALIDETRRPETSSAASRTD